MKSFSRGFGVRGLPAPAGRGQSPRLAVRGTFWSGWPLLALLLLTATRIAVAAAAPLSPDEAYYWVWSRALAPGYLDDAPMVAFWIRGGTLLLGHTALGLRLAGPLSLALGSVLLAGAARDLLPGAGRWVGVLAAALLNATPLAGVGAVILTPDTPLLFFWTAALWGMGRLLATGRAAWWLVVGLAAGLALDSKYTAGLLGIGLALWLVTGADGRRWLRTPWPWAGLALAVAAFAPVVAWNAAHHWASFSKQGGRLADFSPARAMRFLGELVGGQLGLASPGIAAFAAWGVWRVTRRAGRDPGARLLACLVWPGVLLFVQHATGDRVQANWPSVLYPAAAIAAAGVAAGGFWWRPAACLGLTLTLLVYLQAAAAPLALPRRLDVTLIRLGGWQDFAGFVGEVARGRDAAFVAADEYGLAAELAWYLPDETVVATGARWRSFDLPQATIAGRTGLVVRSERQAGAPGAAEWAGLRAIGHLARGRNGVVAERYRLYQATGAGPGVDLP